jgi:hypothetical protein
MSVWFCIPSARLAAEANPILDKWVRQGYMVALWRDSPDDAPRSDLMLTGQYPGYARAVNALAAEVLERDSAADWIVTGGDDTEPDMNHPAGEIAEQCNAHFMQVNWYQVDVLSLAPTPIEKCSTSFCSTFGVMQPTGDRFASGSIDRIAGSPWMGREWCMRANGGVGPLWPEFDHCFSDETLQRTAQRLGVFWQRPDLIHLHRHFMRRDDALDAPAVATPIPPHLVHWNSPQHWEESKAIFKRLEAQNFEPCMPIAIEATA